MKHDETHIINESIPRVSKERSSTWEQRVEVREEAVPEGTDAR